MKKTSEFVQWRTETEPWRSPSRENQHNNMSASRIVNRQVSLLMKLTTKFESHEQTMNLDELKFTSDGMFCKFGGHAFVPISWVC